MSISPDAGSAARNQYGTFQVHYASDKQQAFIRNLVTQRVVPNPAPEAFAPLLDAVRDNRLNKKAASRLIDWLMTLPHARRSDGRARVTGNAGAPGFNPAFRLSVKQFDLIRKLAAQKPAWPVFAGGTYQAECDTVATVTDPAVTADTVEVEKRDASKAIDFLINSVKTTRPGASEAELEAGMYRRADGRIYKVQRAVHGSGMMTCKLLVVDGHGSAHFEYQGLATRFVSADERMTLEQAKEFGAIYGVCCQCGATLTDETSIEAGIGPVCASRF